jgi:hypothetical protein
MQTLIQFDSNSTLQEWGNFKDMLGHKKTGLRSIIVKGNSADKLVYHLNRQLNASLLR